MAFVDLPNDVKEKIRLIWFKTEEVSIALNSLHNTSDKAELEKHRQEALTKAKDVVNRLENLKVNLDELP